MSESMKILLAGDTNRSKDMLAKAKEIETQGASVTCIPLGRPDSTIMLPSISALSHGGYSYLYLDHGWSHSPTSVVLRIIANVIGISVMYSEGAELEKTPRETEAELTGFSDGMLAAHTFMESLENE